MPECITCQFGNFPSGHGLGTCRKNPPTYEGFPKVGRDEPGCGAYRCKAFRNGVEVLHLIPATGWDYVVDTGGETFNDPLIAWAWCSTPFEEVPYQLIGVSVGCDLVCDVSGFRGYRCRETGLVHGVGHLSSNQED